MGITAGYSITTNLPTLLDILVPYYVNVFRRGYGVMVLPVIRVIQAISAGSMFPGIR
jgi:hypothetical protein